MHFQDTQFPPDPEATKPPQVFRDVQHIRDTIGHDVLLLGWPLKSKGTNRPWGHLTVPSMDEKYLADLEGGNIGVVLGYKSGHLVAIDIDRDELVEPFLKANPQLKGTLQTRGSKGRVFWIRMREHSYPTTIKTLKGRGGEHCGEFRSNGGQSIIFGIHDVTGMPYSIIHYAKPLNVAFDCIDWSPITDKPPGISQQTEDLGDKSPLYTETQIPNEVLIDKMVPFALLPAVERCIPTSVHTNHRKLFDLAREVRTYERHHGCIGRPGWRLVFDEWYEISFNQGLLRIDQPKDQYWIEFLHGYFKVKTTLDEGIMERTWELSKSDPTPPELADEESSLLRSAAAFCRRLQILAEGDVFFLSSRKLQALLALGSPTRANQLLQALCAIGLLVEVKKGTLVGRQASQYRYLGSLDGIALAADPISQEKSSNPNPESSVVPAA